MCCITRGIVRWGLISAVALGGATLVLGKQRMLAGLSHVKTQAQHAVDARLGVDMDDPAALRSHLAKLADQYPDRIAEVRGELAEVDHQIAQFERDAEVSRRVVAMTTGDLSELKALVARAEAEVDRTVRPVKISFEGSHLDLDEAYAEGVRINKVRSTYADRIAQNEFQLDFLDEQKTRLVEILDKLEGEYDTYRTQLWQIDQQIEAMERNERLIELTREQQATLDGFEKLGEVTNLGQIEAKLAEMRVKQQATLDQLRRAQVHESYEDRARAMIEGPADEGGTPDPFAEIEGDAVDTTDITADASETKSRRMYAFAEPIIVD